MRDHTRVDGAISVERLLEITHKTGEGKEQSKIGTPKGNL